jgi:membrane fusion protein (multidrug efflux system)
VDQDQQDSPLGRDDGARPRADSGDRPEREGGGDARRSERAQGEAPSDKSDKAKPRRRWPLVLLGVVVVAVAIAGLIYWLLTRDEVTTDDAYTDGNAVAYAAKVSGYVTELSINDNTYVHKGDLLLKIDPRDYVSALAQARASLSLARAQLASAQVDLEMTRVRAPASLQQAQAQLAQARANQAQAQRDYQRQHTVDPRATTQTSIDQATAQMQSTTALVSSAEAQVQVAGLVQQTIKAAKDTVAEREAQIAQAEANVTQAETNLSYTELRAPSDGLITRRNVDLGTFVQAGQQVFYIVTPQVWVTANFKETELADMRPGQHVTMTVDAYPTLHLTGHVDSIQEGSGARFSAFPAENATGNFVKIVRRVPVKIDIDSGLDPDHGLPLGISVEPTVTVR